MYVKKYSNGEQSVVAICDEDILGKSFSEGELCVCVSYEFYGGEKMTDEDVRKIMLVSENLNIIGKRSIKFALDVGIISDDNISFIGGIPYAIVMRL